MENKFRIDKFLKNQGKEIFTCEHLGCYLNFRSKGWSIIINFSFDNNQCTGAPNYMAIIKGIGVVPNTDVKEDWIAFLDFLTKEEAGNAKSIKDMMKKELLEELAKLENTPIVYLKNYYHIIESFYYQMMFRHNMYLDKVICKCKRDEEKNILEKLKYKYIDDYKAYSCGDIYNLSRNIYKEQIISEDCQIISYQIDMILDIYYKQVEKYRDNLIYDINTKLNSKEFEAPTDEAPSVLPTEVGESFSTLQSILDEKKSVLYNIIDKAVEEFRKSQPIDMTMHGVNSDMVHEAFRNACPLIEEETDDVAMFDKYAKEYSERLKLENLPKPSIWQSIKNFFTKNK